MFDTLVGSVSLFLCFILLPIQTHSPVNIRQGFWSYKPRRCIQQLKLMYTLCLERCSVGDCGDCLQTYVMWKSTAFCRSSMWLTILGRWSISHVGIIYDPRSQTHTHIMQSVFPQIICPRVAHVRRTIEWPNHFSDGYILKSFRITCDCEHANNLLSFSCLKTNNQSHLLLR